MENSTTNNIINDTQISTDGMALVPSVMNINLFTRDLKQGTSTDTIGQVYKTQTTAPDPTRTLTRNIFSDVMSIGIFWTILILMTISLLVVYRFDRSTFKLA